MYKNILLPYDGSNESRRSVEHGIELAEALGATVHALYFADLPGAPRTIYLSDDDDDVRDEYEQYGWDVTEEVCDMAANAGVECETAVKFGRPSTEIVDYAEEEGMDAIVIGAAYMGSMRSLLGGTTDRVVRTSSVPVITYRIERNE